MFVYIYIHLFSKVLFDCCFVFKTKTKEKQKNRKKHFHFAAVVEKFTFNNKSLKNFE